MKQYEKIKFYVHVNDVLYVQTSVDPWCCYLKLYLHNGSCPSCSYSMNIRDLRPKCVQYHLINGILFQNDYDAVQLRCMEKDNGEWVLKDMHDMDQLVDISHEMPQWIIYWEMATTIPHYSRIHPRMSKTWESWELLIMYQRIKEGLNASIAIHHWRTIGIRYHWIDQP